MATQHVIQPWDVKALAAANPIWPYRTIAVIGPHSGVERAPRISLLHLVLAIGHENGRYIEPPTARTLSVTRMHWHGAVTG
jgi:hypothetical protein